MTRFYSNNFQSITTEALPLARDFVELAETAGLSRPDGLGVEHEVLTFTDSTNYEIVHMDWRDEPGDSFPNRIYMIRAQEGTTAREWPAGTTVYAGVTAATLTAFEGALPETGFIGIETLSPGTVSVGTESVNIQPSRTVDAEIASGQTAIAIGPASAATAINAVAIGNGAAATDIRALALGATASAPGQESVAVGWGTSAQTRAVALGYNAQATNEQAIAIGPGATAAGGLASIAIGGSSTNGYMSMAMGEAISTAPQTFALGWGETHHQDVLNHSFLPAALSTDQATANTDAFWYNSTDEVVAISAPIDLNTAATTTLTVLPEGGVTFYADEIGLIVQSANTVTVQPEISFGVTGNNAKLLAAVTTTGLDAAKKRQRFTSLLSADGETAYTFTVTTAATATALTARVYVRGFAIQDEVA